MNRAAADCSEPHKGTGGVGASRMPMQSKPRVYVADECGIVSRG